MLSRIILLRKIGKNWIYLSPNDYLREDNTNIVTNERET